MLPHEECDAQKLQKKRHIGNDIVCVAFLEADDALFWPGEIIYLLIDTQLTAFFSKRLHQVTFFTYFYCGEN